MRAERADPVGLDLGRVRRDEHLGPMTERVCGERHRLTEVAARRRDHAGLGDIGREDLVERASRLEGARVLHQLELQRDPAVEIERARPLSSTGVRRT